MRTLFDHPLLNMCVLIVTGVQGDSVSESRFSVPLKDDQSERRSSLSMQASAADIGQEVLSLSNRTGAGCSGGGMQQRLSEVSVGGSGSLGKIVLDRKRKERHESTSQGQEKKVIRSVSDDESLIIDSGKNCDFRRTLSHDSFNPRKEQNQLLGYTVEMVHKHTIGKASVV